MQEQSNAILFLSSYTKKKDHFNSEHLLVAQKKQHTVANAHGLMDNAARVRGLTDVAEFNLYLNKQENEMIAASVSNALL